MTGKTMEIQKMAWHPDSILMSNGSQQRSDGFCGFENIQSAMCCSGILGSNGQNLQYGRPENGYVGLSGKVETSGTRSGGIVGNVGAGYSSRNHGFNGSFICDEVQKPHPALEYSHSLFSNWDHRNPLLESMTSKASQNNENSDVGQFSPGSGLNSRQNLDDLVSKILEEDPSKSCRHDDGHTNGLEERKFGLLPMPNLDFGTNLNNIWSSDEKLSVMNQSQQAQLNNAPYSNAGLLKSVLDGNWEATKAAPGFLQNQSIATSGVQSMDHANFSQRKPIASLLAVENHNQFPQAYNHKLDATTSRSFGSLAMKSNPAEMELAMRCMEKSVPLTSSQYKFSEAPNSFEAWCKSSVNHTQDSVGNRGFLINSYPHGNHSLPCPPNTIAAHVSASPGHSELLLAEVKSTIQSLMGPNPQGNAAKQYLAHCLAQSGVVGGEMLDSLPDDRNKQQNVIFNGGDNNGQNGLRTCFERNMLDHNVLYGGNKTSPATLINGQNISIRPAVKNPVWPSSKTIPGNLLPTAAVLNALATDKREFEMADLPPQTSCGSHFLDQNQLFAYAQPVSRKHGYLTPSSVPCQNISRNMQPDMNQTSEGILNHVQDGPAIFHPDSLYNRQQQSYGIQFDNAGVPKVTQPAHISIRGIQAPWLSSQTHPAENCDCNARCDVHNIGRVTPVILRPGEIFYNNIHPPAMFGLPQIIPDMKLQRCFNSSSGLLLCLEECFEQLRNLEKEEKEVENELMQYSMGRCLASVNPTAIPRLPHNPSRVNRLVVESLREHSKVTAILGKMKKIHNQPLHANIYSAMETWMEGIRKVQARRKEEIVSSANRSNSGGSRAQEEKDILALTAAVEELLIQTRRARTCLWCALQIALYSGSISADKGSTESNNQDTSVFYHALNDWQPAEGEVFNGNHKCM